MDRGQVRTRQVARWARSANIVIAILAVLALIVDAAARLPGTALLSPMARGVFDLSSAPSRRIPALRQEFVRTELGRSGSDAGLVKPRPRSDIAAPPPRRPGGGGGGEGQPQSPPTTRGGLAGFVATPGTWDLRIGMTADRKTVAPGEDINYTITVRNVGAVAFRAANLQMQWRIPFGTAGTQPLPVPCAVSPLPDLGAVCALLEIPRPGLPEEYDSPVTVNYVGASIPAGGSLVRNVRITVTTAVPGSRLSNHANYRVTGAGVTGESNIVVVAVEAPDPTAGP